MGPPPLITEPDIFCEQNVPFLQIPERMWTKTAGQPSTPVILLPSTPLRHFPHGLQVNENLCFVYRVEAYITYSITVLLLLLLLFLLLEYASETKTNP